MEIILDSIKKLLGIEDTDSSFDTEIIMHINSVFMILYQLGVGPAVPFKISSSAETWISFYGNRVDLELVKKAETKALTEKAKVIGISTQPNFYKQIPNYLMDEIAIKTIARSNPFVLILEKGKVVEKLGAKDYLDK